MKSIIAVILVLLTGLSTEVFSGDDPSIKGKTREGIQAAMKHHIGENSLEDRYIIYDAKTGKLNRLIFKELHKGIVKKGDFYVSCADFQDSLGKKYDVDFLVVQKEGRFHLLQGLVHSVDGKKRKYHVEAD
jgi:hypothetical protein